MKISIEDKKTEAISRMKRLGINLETIQLFERSNIISVSEAPYGSLFWATKEELARIREFEEKNNALVYMVVRTYFRGIGKPDSFLFVSDYKDEDRDMDRNDLDCGQLLAYVYNYDTPIFSEFGSIGLSLTPAAGLLRTR